MYGVFTLYTYVPTFTAKKQPNVGKYTIYDHSAIVVFITIVTSWDPWMLVEDKSGDSFRRWIGLFQPVRFYKEQGLIALQD